MGIFNKKTWTLKKAGNRKTFVNLNTSEKIVVSDVTPTTGDEITSDQMNDLENRINDAIDSLDSSKQDSATAITTSNIGSQHVAYADSAGSASTAWSDITGKPTFATVATSGAYDDLSGRPSLATVATSGSYTDLSDKPTIPTVNNATLTIQKNGTNVATFTANASSNATANISVPTNTNQLTNGAGFITSSGTALNVSQKITASAVTHTNYNNNQGYVPAMSFLSYWNGAYNSFNDSNLKYCANGTIIGSSNIGSQSVNYANSAGSATKATQDGDGATITSRYLRINYGGGIASFDGGGNYSYFTLATLTITSPYVNYPITLEVSGRGIYTTRLNVMFNSADNSDPTLNGFYSDNSNRFYIKKTATSTWQIYGYLTGAWGNCVLHRISGSGANGSTSVTVTINMSALSSLPSGTTQVTYGGYVNYATSADHARYINSDNGKSVMQCGNTPLESSLILQADYNLVLYKNGASIWYTGTSSRRFKENINDITEERALKVLELRTVTFDYKDGVPVSTRQKDKVGFIAEEVLEIMPDVVINEPSDEDPDEMIPRNVDYEGVVPYLTKLCQMQQEEINQLKNEITEIKKMLIK